MIEFTIRNTKAVTIFFYFVSSVGLKCTLGKENLHKGIVVAISPSHLKSQACLGSRKPHKKVELSIAINTNRQ